MAAPAQAAPDEVSSTQATPAPSCETTFFGPRRYTRTTGAPNVFDETIEVPPSVVSLYVLRIQNGEADGRNRVSSARVEVNGDEILGISDLNQNVPGLARVVTLTPTTALRVTLASAPGSFLTLSLCGTPGDRTAPRIAWTQPPSFTNDATPVLAVAYEDVAGTGEPASGIDTATLGSLDGVGRTPSSRCGRGTRAGGAARRGHAPARGEDRRPRGQRGRGRRTFTVDARRRCLDELPDALTNAPAPPPGRYWTQPRAWNPPRSPPGPTGSS
jgi:hypothetical protein